MTTHSFAGTAGATPVEIAFDGNKIPPAAGAVVTPRRPAAEVVVRNIDPGTGGKVQISLDQQATWATIDWATERKIAAVLRNSRNTLWIRREPILALDALFEGHVVSAD